MWQLYQDAMAIVRYCGKPDLFITMTCNPFWPDITAELLSHQTAQDRPELVSRVFNLKLKELLYDLKERKFFGRTVAFIHVIEFQKRGLPHAHILIILHSMDKPRTILTKNKTPKAQSPLRSGARSRLSFAPTLLSPLLIRMRSRPGRWYDT